MVLMLDGEQPASTAAWHHFLAKGRQAPSYPTLHDSLPSSTLAAMRSAAGSQRVHRTVALYN
jgi:hypothetical protein